MEFQRNKYLNKLIKKMNNQMIKVITGIRRVGKSYFLFKIFKNYLLNLGIKEKNIICISLEEQKNEVLRDKNELYKYLNNLINQIDNYYVLIDEIQLVENFSSLLNEFNNKENVDIYITGSNSKFISSDIVTELRGRSDEIRIYPLSFAEFSQSFSNKNKSDLFNEYIKYGGLPMCAKMEDSEEKESYLSQILNLTYLKDIVERNKILKSNVEDLKSIFCFLSSNIGSLTNSSKLYNFFKSNTKSNISNSTIQLYLSYLEESFFVEKIARYDVKGKKYLSTPYKYYFTDLGLRNALIEYRQLESNHLLENLVYLELKSRNYSVQIGNIFVDETKDKVRTKQNLEIDFIAKKGNKLFYLQVADNINDPIKSNQEKRPLLKVNDSFTKILIVNSPVSTHLDENGFVIINIIDFLLGDLV
ncbi:ATP-binding protein [Mycoplasmopsis hyopharyngis]|uniref:ATP-binding protein n=1 Tax=Mycoplasmopsis hyopharyngis TaxID=29558 RepID=UPI003873767F